MMEYLEPYLGSLLIVVSGVAEHEPHVLHHGLLAHVLVCADVVVNGAKVHRLQDDLVVVRVVLLGGLDHEQVTKSAAGVHLSRLCQRSEQHLHAVLLSVLLVAGKGKEAFFDIMKKYTEIHSH